MPAAPHRVPLSPPPANGTAGPRRSLVLAGGGMRVAYQAGVLRALAEHDLTFAHGDGTSGGTINLAMLLSGNSPVEMCNRWRTLDVKDFVSLMPLKDYLKALDMIAMGDADGIVERVFPHLGVDVPSINAATGMVGTFNLCNFSRKTVESVPHTDVDLDLLVAGVSLPIFMPPVRKNGALYIDAVWIKDANLMEAVRRGAEEIWLVWCIGNSPKYKTGAFNQYVHMIEMSANGVLFEELDRINEINDRIRAGDHVGGRTRPIALHVIKPEYPLPLDPDFYFGRITAAALIDMGYADAERYLRSMDAGGVPLQPEATRMREPEPGITFRETMAGEFALGATDPTAIDAVPKSDRAELAMHASIAIHDLRRFIDEPAHGGTLTGEIDFPPFGRAIPAKRGVFNLFSPSENPARRLMIYELGFEHAGKDYYLAGRKVVEDGPGFDLWKDTTTLFTTLHAGKDSAGPVVGAGTLRLGVTDLVKLVSTMHATGTDSLGESAKTIAEFGRFFLGQLWSTYAPGQ